MLVGSSSIVIVVLVLAFVLYRQVKARPASLRGMFLLPVILLVIGVLNLSHLNNSGHFSSTATGYLAADLIASAVFGAARGWFIRLFPQGGVLWRQGGAVTVALWIVSIAIRVVIGILAGHAGAADVSNAALLASLGLTLLCQSAVLLWRGNKLGIPWAATTSTTT